MYLFLCLLWLTASLLLIEHSHIVSEISKEILLKLLTTISYSYINLYKIDILYLILDKMSIDTYASSAK